LRSFFERYGRRRGLPAFSLRRLDALAIGRVVGDESVPGVARKVAGATWPADAMRWFRQRDGEWLWPGLGENARVLEWIHRRCDDAVPAVETPIGLLPGSLEVDGLSVDLDELLHVDPEEWRGEIAPIREFYASLGASLPAELEDQLSALERRLS
jgi:GTP-dependent phosphoenolpyruvate carboxykinase